MRRLCALLAAAVLAPGVAAAQSPPMRRLPAPAAVAEPARRGDRTAVFGGGCFWGVQAVFAHVKGVRSAVSGYAGDATDYRTVSTGLSGAVEAVEVTYDPSVVSYAQLLQIFMSVVVDPTEAGGQTPDHGPQYQATVFYDDGGQKRAALAYLDQLSSAKAFDRPIAVAARPDHGFHEAEPFHQDYVGKHPDLPYVRTYDLPRLEGLKRLFPELYVEAAR